MEMMRVSARRKLCGGIRISQSNARVGLEVDAAFGA